MMLNFVIGSLPWDNTFCSDNTKLFGTIGKMKELDEIQKICEPLPLQFSAYMNYVFNLGFDQEPDYDYLEQLVEQIGHENGFVLTDNIFDWATKLSCKDLKYT